MLYRSLLPGALALGTFWLAGCGDTATEPPASAEPTAGAPALAVTSNSWITRNALPMTRSGHAVATVTNAAGQSIVYVIGGATATNWASAKVAAYNVATNTWSWPRQLPVPVAASNGAGVINGKIYVSGGRGPDELNKPSRALYMFNPSANSWTRKRDIPIVTINGEQRIAGLGVTGVINNKLYVVAGCFTLPIEWYYYVESCPPLFFRYDPATNGWTRLPSPFGVNTPTTSPFGAGVIGGKFYLTANSDLTYDARFSVYDPATNRWTPKPILGRARTGAATAVLGGKLYVMGGYLEGPPWTHETLDLTSVFNPTTNLWSQRARLPSPRAGIAGATVMLSGKPRIEVIGGIAPGNNLQYIP